MRVERVLGDVDVAEVQAVTQVAFAANGELDPPSGALAETPETVAADFATEGGVLLRDDDGRLVATCRVRRRGLAWVVRRCAVDPSYRRTGAGRRLAADLRAGDLVLLSGPLGAGKTALTQGIGAGLGVRGAVTSPTFVLARVNPGQLPLVHVDAYRLRESGSSRLELDDLDLDASLPDSVTVVEWGEGLAEDLSDARLEVRLARPDEGTRLVQVTPYGDRWSAFAEPPVVR